MVQLVCHQFNDPHNKKQTNTNFVKGVLCAPQGIVQYLKKKKLN